MEMGRQSLVAGECGMGMEIEVVTTTRLKLARNIPIIGQQTTGKLALLRLFSEPAPRRIPISRQ